MQEKASRYSCAQASQRTRAKPCAERPHEALLQRTPAEHFVRSPRPYLRRLTEPEYPGHYQVRYVSRNGGVRWHNRWVNVSHVLAEEYVGLEVEDHAVHRLARQDLEEVEDGIWSVYFGPVLLGRFHERDYRIHGAHNRNKLYRSRR